MPELASAVLASWSVSGWLASAVLLTTALYLRGFRDLHARMPARFPRWRLVAFLGGVATLVVAIASPLDAFAFLLLPAHMVQHVLLFTVAPPLLLLGYPAHPLLRGLPAAAAKSALGPLLAWPALRHFGERLAHPLTGALAITLATWGWHVPAAYELALRVPAWHAVEHATFFFAGLLFWWPVVQPWPSRARWSRWAMLPYLLFADLQNITLAAFFVFSDRVLYPSYAAVPRLSALSVLEEQTLAGLLMWVPMSIAYLVPAGAIAMRLLSPARVAPIATPPRMRTVPAAPRFDLLAVPYLGALLRARRFRWALKVTTLTIAVAVVVDGFFGSEIAPMNLAGVVPWTYWRGAVVVGLMVAGNLFCPACPFLVPRDLVRRFRLPRLRWPRALRSKWLTAGLIAVFLWATETFSLWDDPAWTASLVLAYFGVALLVDALFQGASFCKYVCPIGSFQFVQSLVSPLEVAVRHSRTCAGCATHDCLEGNARSGGCELELFAPRKAGSFDCTFCLDCVRACPHDNIGIRATAPGRALLRDPDRSSFGRLSRRLDVAALALVVVFGAFASAASMVGPVARWQQQIATRLGLASARPVVTATLVVALAIAPGALALLAAALGRRIARVDLPLRALIARFALALLPLGLAMWTAHFLLHLIAGWRSIVPVLQGFAPGLLGPPNWALCLPGIAPDSLLGLEMLFLDGGLLVTLWIGWHIAGNTVRRLGPALALLGPWALLATALWLGGVWSLLQPMAMRGLMSPS